MELLSLLPTLTLSVVLFTALHLADTMIQTVSSGGVPIDNFSSKRRSGHKGSTANS